MDMTRTRASIAIIGEETSVIDCSPDLSSQLERELLRKIDNIFLTHWHFDHVWGLAEIVEPKFMSFVEKDYLRRFKYVALSEQALSDFYPWK